MIIENKLKKKAKQLAGVDKFEEYKKLINDNMQILNDENATQSQKYEAAIAIRNVTNSINQQYETGEGFIQARAEELDESLNKGKDDRTDGELRTIEVMQQEFSKNAELLGFNQETIEKIIKDFEDGKKLNIDIEEQKDGDYVITGEAIEEVIEQQQHRGISAVVHNIKDFFQMLKQGEVNKNAEQSTEIKDTDDIEK